MTAAHRPKSELTTGESQALGTAATSPVAVRINVGCGPTPTPGWINYDNSWSVRIAGYPLALKVLERTPLLTAPQLHFTRMVRSEGVRLGTALKIAHEDGTVDVVYSSHMIEHLDRDAAAMFLAEARRVLRPGGILRVVVPDLALLVHRYNASGNADELIAASLLASAPAHSILGRLRYIVVGSRHHAWMYDARSLAALVENAGFKQVACVPAGTTRIQDPGALDLSERAEESVYIEASNPGAQT